MSIEARFKVTRGAFSLDVELKLPSAAVTGVLGPSGSGKTTLLRAIAGLDRHPEGYLKVEDLTWQGGGQFLPTHERALGYVFQEASLFPHLTVRANLEYGVKRVPDTELRVSLTDAVELLGIEKLLDRNPDTLSGGERQRVAIARALAVSPRLLLMDEPLANLDQELKSEVLPYIESLQDELDIPVIYVSHSRDEVARLADELVMLDAGRVTVSGDIAMIFSHLDLPLAHDSDAAAIIDAKIAGHDEDYDLTQLDFSGGRITIPRAAMQVGDRARLRIAARDVSLTLEHQASTSILNIFPAMVDDIADEGSAQVTVRLVAGEAPLLARITRKSADELAIRPGKRVYAQVKSVALLT
jgi:molybdate transport system ATP-binding protein